MMSQIFGIHFVSGCMSGCPSVLPVKLVCRGHRSWYDRLHPELFAGALVAAKHKLDSKGSLNTGVLVGPLVG